MSTFSSTTERENPYLLTLPQLLSAKKKIGKVSASFDSNKVSLRGFESESLNPTEFRELIRRSFELHLTDAELGAIVVLCDKEGNGRVNSNLFLAEFFRLGKMEKAKQYLNQKADQELIIKRKQKIITEHEQKLKELTKFSIANEWTEKDDTNAFKKLAKVAFLYDNNKHKHLQGFIEGGYMTIFQFKDQLRRNLDINLTPSELAALCHRLQGKKELKKDCINCNEFLFHFLRLGREERERNYRLHIARDKSIQEKLEERMRQKEEKYSSRALAKLATPTPEDQTTALAKIHAAALVYDPDKYIGFKAFEGTRIDPTAFREQMKANLNIRLTPSELKAMLELFDKAGNGYINTLEFMSYFNRIGEEERLTVATKKHVEQTRNEERRERQKAVEEEQARKRRETRVIWPSLPGEDNFEDSAAVHRSHSSSGSRSAGKLPSIELHQPWSAPSPAALRTRSNLRKPSVQEILSPNKMAQKLSKKKTSLTALFPKASADVKEFIKEVEKKEKQIKKMKNRGSKKSRKPQPQRPVRQSSNGESSTGETSEKRRQRISHGNKMASIDESESAGDEGLEEQEDEDNDQFSEGRSRSSRRPPSRNNDHDSYLYREDFSEDRNEKHSIGKESVGNISYQSDFSVDQDQDQDGSSGTGTGKNNSHGSKAKNRNNSNRKGGEEENSGNSYTYEESEEDSEGNYQSDFSNEKRTKSNSFQGEAFRGPARSSSQIPYSTFTSDPNAYAQEFGFSSYEDEEQQLGKSLGGKSVGYHSNSDNDSSSIYRNDFDG